MHGLTYKLCDERANCLSVVFIYVQTAIFGGSGKSREIL